MKHSPRPKAASASRVADLIELVDLVERPGDLEAAPAAAEGGLDRDRQAVGLGERAGVAAARHRSGAAGDQRRAHRLGDAASLDLVAERLDHLGIGSDPDQTRRLNRAGELGALGEEAVARMHRLGAGAEGDVR